MRLFVAINFDEDARERLMRIQRRLRACADGNFTRPENLHLTVLFLGEVSDDAAVRRGMDARFVRPIELIFDRVGRFRGDLYWVGIRPSPALDALYAGLRDDLTRAGFRGDWGESITAHVTIARAVSLRARPELSFLPFSTTARRLSLMKSERIAGRLTYTQIYAARAQYPPI